MVASRETKDFARHTKTSYGSELHRDDDYLLHSDDGPAAVWMDGTKLWYQHGKLHREDGPAVISPSGKEEWYWLGKRHRSDGPAVTSASTEPEWWDHGDRRKAPAS